MIRHKLGRLVQWKEKDAHMVGQVVENINLFWKEDCLVALAHTHELVSVDRFKLSDYPSEPIPEPTK